MWRFRSIPAWQLNDLPFYAGSKRSRAPMTRQCHHNERRMQAFSFAHSSLGGCDPFYLDVPELICFNLRQESTASVGSPVVFPYEHTQPQNAERGPYVGLF